MKRRLTAVAGVVAFLVLALTGPAAAAPRDAQGCDNTRASQLDDYCTSTGG